MSNLFPSTECADCIFHESKDMLSLIKVLDGVCLCFVLVNISVDLLCSMSVLSIDFIFMLCEKKKIAHQELTLKASPKHILSFHECDV